ncbi:MAG: hypothetical protein E6Q97_04280 [Desulfurellales bacterium]|nr:MAG: hypothetical protein E6Q97_04280 [Desulfurellales bacterium]
MTPTEIGEVLRAGAKDAAPLRERIAELERLLARSHAFILEGPASNIARDNHLREIAVALGWPKAEAQVAGHARRLQDW